VAIENEHAGRRALETAYERIEWADVLPIAREAFNRWLGDGELRWAEHAWHALDCASMTKYATESERTVCVLRLLALGVLHQEFSARAFDEGTPGDWRYEPYGDYIGQHPWLDAFTLGHLAKSHGLEFDNAPEDVEDAPGQTTRELVELCYSDAVHALRTQWSDSYLFATLWLSVKGEPDYPLSDAQVDEVVNWDLTGNKLHAWQWFSEGLSLL
jgi:hypothetical protein